MITIAWYNVAAIAVGLLAVFLIWKEYRDFNNSTGYASGINNAIHIVVILFFAALFYAIWGGIFWW